MKAGAVPVAALAALSVASLAPGRLGTALVVLAPAAGFMAPDVWLRARARDRARRMAAEEADVLDLLRVAVGAGLSPWRALAEVGRRHPGLLAGELGAAARRVALGVPAEQALARLQRRCPAGGCPRRRGGAPAGRPARRLPGRALAALAAEARAREARRAAERAAKAAPKIQLVVALLLVPSVLLLVAAALVPALSATARLKCKTAPIRAACTKPCSPAAAAIDRAEPPPKSLPRRPLLVRMRSISRPRWDG